MQCKENMGEILSHYMPETLTERIEWSIPNIFNLFEDTRQNPEQYVSSPCFLVEDHTWHLALIRHRGNDNYYIGLFIYMQNRDPPIPEYNVKLGLNCEDPSYIEDVVGKLDCFGQFGKWKFMNLRKLEYKEKSRPNGFLNFFCEIWQEEKVPELWKPEAEEEVEISSQVPAVDVEKNDGSEAEGIERLLQNFKKLLLDGQNSDVILNVENREFPVYRGILSVRSPVFASMFQHDLAEKNSDVIDIPDCSAEAFEVFLLYLYTGRADVMSRQNVFNLYYAADKYSVHDLKKDCVEFMKNILSVDTFCDVITLSLRHSEPELQKVATRYFCENVKKIVKSVTWQKYLKEHPVEANELYIKAIDA